MTLFILNTANQQNNLASGLRWLAAIPIIGFALVGCDSGSSAKGLSPYSSSSQSAVSHRSVSVIGKAEVRADADIAVLQLTINELAKTSLAAKSVVDKKANNLFDGLKAFDIDETDISASGLSTQPQYQYRPNNPRELTGYMASRQIKLTLNNIDNLNGVMDFILSIDINEIGNVALKSSQEAALKQEATLLATKNATQQGKWLANSFGAQLGKVHSINAVSDTQFGRYGQNDQIEAMAVSRLRAPKTDGRYLHEELVFTSTIKAVFDLEVDN